MAWPYQLANPVTPPRQRGRSYPLTSHAQATLNSAHLAYQWGLTPIPLAGKVPTTMDWPHTPYQSSLAEFEHFLHSRPPAAQDKINVGILTGAAPGAPNPVVVIDLDPKPGGLIRWEQLLAEAHAHGLTLPPTLTVRTGSGGLHIYFRYEPKIADIPKIPGPETGVEYQANLGQVVFPFSIHPRTGQQYLFETGFYQDTQGHWHPILASMPDWLADYLRSLRK